MDSVKTVPSFFEQVQVYFFLQESRVRMARSVMVNFIAVLFFVNIVKSGKRRE